MNAEELYAIICKLPRENFADYGIMVPFNKIYTFLDSKNKNSVNPAIVESDLENLQKCFPDKIKLILDNDMIQGVQFLN